MHLFDIARESWWEPSIIGYPTFVRFGMASVSLGSSIVVFGGSNASQFHDGDLYEVETDQFKFGRL